MEIEKNKGVSIAINPITLPDDFHLITFAVAEGKEASYVALIKAIHEDDIRKKIAKKDCIFVGMFGKLQFLEAAFITDEIVHYTKTGADVTFQSIDGIGLGEEQVAIVIAGA